MEELGLLIIRGEAGLLGGEVCCEFYEHFFIPSSPQLPKSLSHRRTQLGHELNRLLLPLQHTQWQANHHHFCPIHLTPLHLNFHPVPVVPNSCHNFTELDNVCHPIIIGYLLEKISVAADDICILAWAVFDISHGLGPKLVQPTPLIITPKVDQVLEDAPLSHTHLLLVAVE